MMIHASGLPRTLWGEAFKHAVWLKNRTSTRALKDKTPHEMLTGEKPNLLNLQEWGAKVWVHDDSNSKLDARARVGRWVGFEEDSNAHRMYWPDTQKIRIERSIKFDSDWVMIPNKVAIEGELAEPNRNVVITATTPCYISAAVSENTRAIPRISVQFTLVNKQALHSLGNIPVVHLGVVAGRRQILADLVGYHHRTVVPARTAECDGEITLAFADVMRQ